MQAGGAKHGPIRDDQLWRETRGEVRSGRATHAEEWREMEPPGEDQPEAEWELSGSRAGAPPGMTPTDVELRSELARFLGRSSFPGDRDSLRRRAVENHAPDWLVELVGGLPPDTSFRGLPDVLRSVGIHEETGRF